jgi:hypothetical protein
MTTKRGHSLVPLSFPASLLLVGVWVTLVRQRHDFVVLEVEAFGLSKSASSINHQPLFQYCSKRQTATATSASTRLRSTSASAAYLDSISYRPPTAEDGLLGATSNYLEALSSVSNQMAATANFNYNYNYNYNYAQPNGAVSNFEAQVQSSVVPEATQHVSFEDQLLNEVVQKVTQEFSSALESFAGEKYDSFVDSTSTWLAESTPAYIWDIEEASDKARKGTRAMKDSIQKAVDANANANPNTNTNANSGGGNTANPEDALRELTTKFDNSFRSFKENVSSSRHSVTNSLADSVGKDLAQPNAAVNAAARQKNIGIISQKLEEGSLSPEALSTSAKEAVGVASSVANKGAMATTSALQKSFSETASSANAAIGGVTESLGSLVTNTNQGIGKALSTMAETTNAASSVAMGSVEAAGSAIASGASSAMGSVQGSLGAAQSSAKAAGAALASGASSGANSVHGSLGAVGSSTKAAMVTAQPGTAATAGKISGVALSASQGFGMPGNAYSGGGDVAGLIEMVAATIVSIPRALVDATMMETNPNGMDDLMKDISGSLTKDVLVPLSQPLRAVAAASGSTTTTATPLDQAQAVLETLNMVLGLVVGIPRAALEGLTGLTIGELQVQLSQTDVKALAEQLSGFASAVSTVLVALLKVVAQAISTIVTQTGLGSAMAQSQEELVSDLVNFVVQDLLPAILDGLLLILQQFAMLLLEGGSMILSAM